VDGQPSVEVPEEFKTKFVSSTVLTLFHELTIITFRTGTANRILETKEKEREKETDKGKGKEKSRKKAKRWVVTQLSAHVHF